MKRIVLLTFAALAAVNAWADTKISALPAASAQTGTEVLPEFQSGQCAATLGTCGVTVNQLKTFTNASLPAANLSGQVVVANGGTGLATLTAHGLLVGEGTSNVAAVAAMALDTLLQGKGASADPAAVSLVNCGDGTHALAYSTTTHTFSCQALSTGTTSLTATQVGFGNGSNVLTGSTALTWDDTNTILTIGKAGVVPSIVGQAQGGLTISLAANGSFATGGALALVGTNGSGVGVGGGDITLTAGTSASSTAGKITFSTATNNGGAATTRLTINQTGTASFTSSVIQAGTTFTLGTGTGACATTGTLVGGAAAGSFHCTGTAGASTQVINLPTSTNGYSCSASDLTSGVGWATVTGGGASSAKISGTIATTNDTVVFNCIGY